MKMPVYSVYLPMTNGKPQFMGWVQALSGFEARKSIADTNPGMHVTDLYAKLAADDRDNRL